MNQCIANVGSITRAMKAQALLRENGIEAEIIKLDPAKTKRGCAYGVIFSCRERTAVRRLLGSDTEIYPAP